MTREIALGPGAEFDAIRLLLARWGARAIGIGDDAAMVDVPRGEQLIVSVDSSVEGRHFRPEWSSPREIGYRAVAAALSDIAAMAARPLGVLVAITLPDLWRSRLSELADGIGEGAESASTSIIGGNMSSGDELSIATIVLGGAFRPLRRDGARVGDEVYVTGVLGGPRAALQSLEAGKGAGVHEARLKRPRPRIREAQWLAENGATAAIDISDGFVADLRHIAAASHVGITIDGRTVPRAQGVSLEDALASGEEYELVVATSGAFDVDEFERRFDLPLTHVGRIDRDAATGVTVSGARVANIFGHNHFSR